MKQNVFRKVLSSDVSKWICWQICTACACDINHTSWLKWHHGAFSLSRQVRWDLCAATEKMQIAMQLLTVINTINLLIWTNACAEFYHPACHRMFVRIYSVNHSKLSVGSNWTAWQTLRVATGTIAYSKPSTSHAKTCWKRSKVLSWCPKHWRKCSTACTSTKCRHCGLEK